LSEDAVARERIDFLRGLRATRDFTPEPIPSRALQDMIEVARLTGTASNRQLWDIVVVTERAMLHQLSQVEGSASHLAAAQVGIVIANSGTRPQQAIFDEGRLAERIMLAAHAHGLGSSIGWFRDSGRVAAKILLGIPDDRFVRTAISVGRAASEHGRRRKSLDQLVHYERF